MTFTIDTFFVDPFQFRSIRSALAAKENIYGKEVLLQRINGEEFRALINVVVVENDSMGMWCEGSIEELSASHSKQNRPFVGLETFSATFIMDAPVSSIMSSPFYSAGDTSVKKCASIMKENNVKNIIVLNQDGSPAGIIDSGTIGLRLSEGALPETEISEWMVSPVTFISDDSRIIEAFSQIGKCKARCLLAIEIGRAHV